MDNYCPEKSVPQQQQEPQQLVSEETTSNDRLSRPSEKSKSLPRRGGEGGRSPPSRPWRQTSPSKQPSQQQVSANRASTLPRNYLRASSRKPAVTAAKTQQLRQQHPMRKAASERRLAPPGVASANDRPRSDLIHTDGGPVQPGTNDLAELEDILQPTRNPVQHSPVLPRKSPIPPPSHNSITPPGPLAAGDAQFGLAQPSISKNSSKVSTPLLHNNPSRPTSRGNVVVNNAMQIAEFFNQYICIVRVFLS